MTTNFPLFGPTHLFILVAVPFFAGVLALIQRRLLSGAKGLRIGLAIVILLDSVLYYGYLIARG